MNCSTDKGLMIIGDTYHRSFVFEMPDPDSLTPDNPSYIPMDLSLYDIRYYLYAGGKYLVDKSTGFDITDNQIDIEVLPDVTKTASPVIYKEIFIFTLISDPTKITTQYTGEVQAKQRNQ